MNLNKKTIYSIPHEDFKQNRLSLLVPSSLASAKLLLNDTAIIGKRNIHIVHGDSGKATEVTLRHRFYDSVPDVIINKDKMSVAPKLTWYQYALAMIPFSLAVFGGAIGGAFGFIAMRFNIIILRADMTWPWKIFGCFITSFLAAFLYFMIAIPLSLLMR